MSIAVLGAGAFGTALGMTLCRSGETALWARDPAHAAAMQKARTNNVRLPGVNFPANLVVTSNLDDIRNTDTLLIAVPMQKLRDFLLSHHAELRGKTLVVCCKGIELKTGLGPMDILHDVCPENSSALLTGPSFARDIARGLPTALTLACTDIERGIALQKRLSNNTLRLYRTTDVIGASLGGALKNVIAIACGAVIGAGLGDSARAALMTRGNAEMQRMAAAKGAEPATLSGLAGFGDLVLTCTSDLSRNYQFGYSIGSGASFNPETTVEGAATAQAVSAYAKSAGLDMPISNVVAGLVQGQLDVKDAMNSLLSRSLKEE